MQDSDRGREQERFGILGPCDQHSSEVIRITRQVVIFGAGRMAELVTSLVESESDRTVVGFAVDARFVVTETLLGRPVVPVTRILELTDPSTAEALVAVGPQRGLRLREEALALLRGQGFGITHHISRGALVWPGLDIEPNVIIHAGAVVDPFTRIGEGVTVRSNATVGHHADLGASTFVASGAVLGGGVRVGARCFLGLGSTVRDEVTIAPGTFVGAGAVVTRDTEPGVYVGVPARPLSGRSILDVT